MKFTQAVAVSILILVGILFGEEGLDSLKRVQTSPIQTPYYQEWTAGVQGGGGGIIITIELITDSSIAPDSVFYRGMSGKLKSKDSNTRVYTSSFSYRNLNSGNNILAVQTKKKVTDSLYSTNEELQNMNLKKENCVVSYYRNEEHKYIIFDSISKKDNCFLPHRN